MMSEGLLIDYIKAVIFDLDETLIDTRFLKPYRDKRDWSFCYRNGKYCMLYPGIKAVLDYLKESSKLLGIVTMAPKKYAVSLLNVHNIHYDSLMGYHDCSLKKPHPEPLLKCAALINIEPNFILAIGDDVRDIAAANRAGMISVGVTWGVASKEQLVDAKASFICDNSEGIIKILNKKYQIIA